MDPDPGGGIDALLFKHRELLEGRHGRPGMRADRETGLEVRDRARADQLLLHFAERTAVETQLDEAWTYSRSVNPVCPLIDPTLGQRFGGYGVNVRRQVFVA